ncbi:MAG TPA: hypothetical protein VG937_29685 [Polyangiaceae bacterium]|nr:hypothetical protein [Polyangiaceae bacterium]
MKTELKFGVAALIVCTSVASSRAEQGKRAPPGARDWLDVPSMHAGREVGGVGSGMRVDCRAQPNTVPRQAHCTLSRVFVSKRRAQEVEDEKALVSALTPKQVASLCKEQLTSSWVRDGDAKAEFEKLLAACRKADGQRVIALLLAALSRRASACEVEIEAPSVEVFEQSNADSWIAVTDAPCGIATKLLWRKSGGSASLWNYKQTFVLKPNAPAACKSAKERTTEWRWDYESFAGLSCDRVQFGNL